MIHIALSRVIPLLLLLGFAAPAPIQAQQDQAGNDYSLQSYLPALVTSHDRILAAAARVQATRYLYRQAWAGWYPHLALLADGGYEYIDRPDEGARDVDVNESSELKNTESLRLQQLIYDFGYTGGSIDEADARYSQAGHAFDAVRQEVLLAGVRAYVDTLRALSVLGYARRSEQNIKQQTGIEEALVQRGAGLSSDVLQAKSQLAAAISRRIGGEGELSNALSYFKAVFQQEPDSGTLQQFSVPDIPQALLPTGVDNAVALAFEHNPRLLAALKNVQAFEGGVEVARSRYYPSFFFVSDGTRKENDYSVSGVRTEARALVELRYELYSGGADSAALEAAKAERVRALRELDDLRRQVEQQARTAWSNYQTAQRRTESLSTQVDILYEFLELARKERRLGKRSLLDVLSGEVDYIIAQSNLAAARAETVKAAYELLYAMGRLTPEALNLHSGGMS
ncbi:TolC family outer membrane protein [Desulfocurvibacter africanus]|uniref:Type I secretion outer membrane protein, TolC family n=1 Tax=Desulfocurvibacter africanus subsp. africanus str. Walvis Bay TaxID=690850 RepID=F3Z184_DESAF|nr:TolC family outer membrane protein [Desulfocurvibacter africanus]EGJ51087.1 type I secretion outer membrane protein, TolC family [Desulfocurvibacter africanus subsp. africanus str. Walvis Bay]